MKKKYEKPMVLFEDFTMSTNIANTCDIKTNTQVKDICGIPGDFEGFEGMNVYVDGVNGCDLVQDDGTNNGICYHVPLPTSDLFAS